MPGAGMQMISRKRSRKGLRVGRLQITAVSGYPPTDRDQRLPSGTKPASEAMSVISAATFSPWPKSRNV